MASSSSYESTLASALVCIQCWARSLASAFSAGLTKALRLSLQSFKASYTVSL